MWNWNTMHALLKIFYLHFQSQKKKIEKKFEMWPQSNFAWSIIKILAID